MKEKIPFSLMVMVALLVLGNLIGAGILALPIQTGLAGFLPSILGMVFIGAAMYFSALVLGFEATHARQATFNFPSIYQKYLGSAGKWVAIAANMILLYGLLTAYLAGATSIIMNLFHVPVPGFVVMLLFFLVFTTIVITGISLVEKYNAVLTIVMFTAFAAIILMGERHIDISRYAYRDWGFLISIAPIAVTAFHFHNIIPTISRSLKWNFSALWKTMLAGMFLGYLMNILWIQVGIGALPLAKGQDSILNAFEANLPATVPMAQEIHSPLFVIGSLIFALLAVSTSYLANGIGLTAFVEDLMENHIKKTGKLLKIAVAFGPPLVISLIYPNIFLKAIDVAGGVGIVILFGVLPCIIALLRFRNPAIKAISVLMLVLFSIFFIFELGQESHLLKIKPDVESWDTPAFHKLHPEVK